MHAANCDGECTERTPKYWIGQKFTIKRKGFSREYTVTDIYFTRNAAGALIKFEYQTYHYLAGQHISELVCETTIAKALWDSPEPTINR